MVEDINLLKRDISRSGILIGIEDKLRMISWWSLVSLLASGVILGTLYFVLVARVQNLQQDAASVSQQINALSIKEGILLSLKQRIDIAKKTLDAARPWGNIFGVLNRMANPTDIHTISIDETGKVTVMFALASVDDSVNVVKNVITLSEEKKLRSPQLLSFVIQQNGAVQLHLSFIPIF